MESPNLKQTARRFLETISIRRDAQPIADDLHPDILFYHDDMPPMSKQGFLEFWPQLLEKSPKFRLTITSCISEGSAVWVYSEVEGRLGKGAMDDIHMFEFDEAGRIMKSRGIQREKHVSP